MKDHIKFSRRSVLFMPLALAACKPGHEVLELVGATMGTQYKVIAVDPTKQIAKADVQNAIDGALLKVNKQMSNWDSSSQISQFNAQRGNAKFNMSAELAQVMQAAEQVNIASEGRFDTTMGPLIELWGFGASGKQGVPSESAIREAQARSGQQNTLKLASNSVQKLRDDAQVYLSAIGKGFGSDEIGRSLEALGIKDYMVEIGGDIYAAGKNPNGQPWRVGIEKPAALSTGVVDVVGVSGLGLASSGDYRNYFEKDGQRYSHIIDPATGRPITHTTASATVLAPSGMLADAWATAMLILGRERGLEIAEKEGLAVYFVERDTDSSQLKFKSSASSNFKALEA